MIVKLMVTCFCSNRQNFTSIRPDATPLLAPFPKRQILDSSKLEEFANANFQLDLNGGEFFKQVENTVGKGEIARREQFLIFPQCFLKTCTEDT